MKGKALAISMIAIAAVSVTLAIRNDPSKQLPQANGNTKQAGLLTPESSDLGNAPARTKANATTGKDGYFTPITGGNVRLRAPIDPFPNVPKDRSNQPLQGDPFIAESAQEQRWLDRNGYPNAEQWKAYSTASDLALEQAAAHGDSVAEVMLTGRQLAKGDSKATEKLITAGSNGSTFALSLLASYMANGKHGNPEMGYALSRLIELRGDWRAGITRDMMFRSTLTAEQRVRGEAEAIRLLHAFSRGAGAQTYLDPRPLSPKIKED